MAAPRLTSGGPAHATVVRHKGVTLVACFAINLLSSAFYRNAAFFYPFIMETFLVNREQASLPLFVYAGFYYLGVLLGGTVIQLLTVWVAAVVGGFLLSVTFLACCFANGILFLTLVLGVLGGIGQGIMFNCSIVGLGDNFPSWRGLAIGVVTSGAPASSLIFSTLFKYVLELHGLRGTLLLTGACLLNVPAFALLLRNSPPNEAEETRRQRVFDVESDLFPEAKSHHVYEHPSLPTVYESKVIVAKGCVRNHSYPVTVLRQEHSFSDSPTKQRKACSILKTTPNKDCLRKEATGSLSVAHMLPPLKWPTCTNDAERMNQAKLHGFLCSVPALNHCSATINVIQAELQPAAIQWQPRKPSDNSVFKWNALIESVREVAATPRIYVIAYSFYAYSLFLDTFLTVNVDYAVDSGISDGDAMHIVAFFSVTDTLCRFMMPCLTDRKLLSTTTLLASSSLVTSLFAGSLPFITGKVGFWSVALAVGLPSGCINVGISEYASTVAGEENQPMALGFMSTAAAVGSFTAPSLIGLFRDSWGSYDGLFYFMASTLVVQSVLFAALSAIDYRKSRKFKISR
ncbi:monocarboxylate transporter 9-like [Dermacentor variabilis]|uniref:monocarboxylate transporter 9-like n=1 Tax=Dermacentor variabilis TaxID=34621 RepID=UPI003F5BCE11